MVTDQSQSSPQDVDDGDPINANSKPNFSWQGTGLPPSGAAGTAADDGGSSQSDNEGQSPGSHGNKAPAPMQKRRRVTRACDECRRKKIKCDGKQPCTHCTVYSYDCTYDQPSNRRRNPAPQYIEAIENRLHRAEALLKTVMPDVDLNDPSMAIPGAKGPHFPQPGYEKNAGGVVGSKNVKTELHSDTEKDPMLESMVQSTGALDLDDKGHYDFYGHSSGLVFLKRLRQQFGDLMGEAEGHGQINFDRVRVIPSVMDSPRSADSPMAQSIPDLVDLPVKACAKMLSEVALEDALALMRFIHIPTYYTMFDRIFDTPQEQWGNEENRYLPLVYAVMAVGSLFTRDQQSRLHMEGYEHAVEFGFKYFKAAKSLLDITDCRDLPSLQTVICMIYFLQSSAKLSTCYSYVGVALHSAIRMGLHRSMPGRFNPVEAEIRKRIFWQIRKLDIYIGALLGFPMMLSDDDIDQDQPLEVDDEYITVDGIKPVPDGHISLMAAMNAHTGIVRILQKVSKYIYPLKEIKHGYGTSQAYSVSHARIREIERDLQEWMENLPMGLRPGGNVSPELTRVQQLLRIAYAHTQLFLYRPFLHYTSAKHDRSSFDKRSYACAAACVSVSRNIIHIVGEMSKRGLLMGAYWFAMYTAFLSVVTLVFFVIENPNASSSNEIIKDAREGKEILATLAKRSMAADRCARTLDDLFKSFDKLSRMGSTPPSSANKKRAASPNPHGMPVTHQSTPNVHAHGQANSHKNKQLPRASTFPAKRSSAPYNNSENTYNTSPPHRDMYSPTSDHIPGIATPDSPSTNGGSNGTGPFNSGFLNPQQQAMNPNGNGIPDLSPLMFPTGDPFAYPNQPMTALEQQNLDSKDWNLPQGMFTPTSQPQNNMRANGYESENGGNMAEVQIYGPMPPYMIHGQQPTMNQNSNMFGLGFGVDDLSMGQQGDWGNDQRQNEWAQGGWMGR